MTKIEFENVGRAAIDACGMQATVIDVDCAQNSKKCSATVRESATGQVIYVQSEKAPSNSEAMLRSITEQLRRNKSS